MTAVPTTIDAIPWPDDAARVGRLLADLSLDSESGFRLGSGPPVASSSIPLFPSAEVGTDPASRLREALAAVIYAAAYSRLYAGPGYDPRADARRFSPDPSLVAALDAANPSRAAWDRGWRVFRSDADGAVHVQKGDRATKLRAGRYTMDDLLRSAGVGDTVERARERASLTHQPGLYFAFGETPSCDYDDARMARLYFDVDAASAPWLMNTLCVSLNRYAIPFAFKCPTDPGAYDRQDSAVLYVARRYIPGALALILPARAAFQARLRGGVPLWSKPLFAGVGAADDPGTGESFGQSRSRLVAAGIVGAWEAGRTDVQGRQVAVAEQFRRAGLDVARPHLAMGLQDVYAEAAP